jgi:uncharacterized radical SAM superfamily Fe-S cluster-containing enzyme
MENMKAIFANTINELGSFGVVGASECHNFGSTWGCRIDCPVFERGECKDVYFENIKMFIKDNEFMDEEDFSNVMKLYDNKLSEEEKRELTTDFNNSL